MPSEIFQHHHDYKSLEENLITMGGHPDLVLTNVTLPGGRIADITLQEGRVIHAGSAPPGTPALDCSGMMVLPGAIDMHVHMRSGVQSEKEDWTSGTKSALAGGVTVVIDQPNTIPPLTDPYAFFNRVADAREHSYCHFGINSGVTDRTPIQRMWEAEVLHLGKRSLRHQVMAMQSQNLHCLAR